MIVAMDIRYLLKGAFAGTIAALVMSIPMVVARRAGLVHQHAPEGITRSLLVRSGIESSPSREQQDVVAGVLHLGFGAIGGVMFAAAAKPLARRGRPLGQVPFTLSGMLYGLGVYAVSYLGWLPALGLMPPPPKDEPARPPLMVVAHLIYGAVLARLLGRPKSARRSRGRQG